jgi:hypothetical protein
MNQKLWVSAVFFKDCLGAGRQFFRCAGDAGRTRNPHVTTRLPAQRSEGEPFSSTKFAPAEVTHALSFQ